ncbi:glycoside hydrolase 43 family protein [Paenibacillus allorhizosphaerae]|uniref:glycoside hydrolase family 43 protein n=1 Tax=Paenibacillus allorhizosphaerae TaxID=2849866 RepID=UPI001C401ACB
MLVTNLKQPWIADQGDGTFKNPILYADYSDPDVIRVGSDFYMTASSFAHLPGLPILHSKDLVNWELIGHAVTSLDSLPGYDKPRHGDGVWAPSIRYHDGKFWIFFSAPDEGIFMTTADHPAGPWAPLHCVKEVKGWIDPCPFWDEDGQAYLVHAFARSRCGIKHRLQLLRMSPDGKELLGEGHLLYDGEQHHPTMEGPKVYKRNGYYYVFAPAGGVATGWQTILRSKDIYGPYEDRIVLHQGSTDVNGPHQGGWVELESGESWFIHFQDKDAYGRIVHLQPVRWVDDWPLMGVNPDENGVGEPVLRMKKPDVGGEYPVAVPATSDDFAEQRLGLQWQWQANPQQAWYALGEKESHLRLYAVPTQESGNGNVPTLYAAPQLLMQKLPAPAFTATAKLSFEPDAPGDRSGLIVFGLKYAGLGLIKDDGGSVKLAYWTGDEQSETVAWQGEELTGTVFLRVTVAEGALCSFSFSTDGDQFEPVGQPFTAKEGRWVGAKVGVFAANMQRSGSRGYVDVDWFEVSE